MFFLFISQLDKALKQLSSVVIQRRTNVFEPLISTDRTLYRNMLVLGHYRNKMLHIFFFEAVFAVAFAAPFHHINGSSPNNNVGGDSNNVPIIETMTFSRLLADTLFLTQLLEREVVSHSTAIQVEVCW